MHRLHFDQSFSFLCAVAQMFAALLALAMVLTQPASARDLEVARADTPLQLWLDAGGIDLSLPARGKVIVVNLPAFEAIAIENGNEVFRSRVIVGTPWTPTPLIDTHVTSVRFRPTWRPTPSMVASGEYPDRIWPPGPDNPLGLAAVRLVPPLLVYLHDTNRPALFKEENRALSHGCIRVERWDDLVSWILNITVEEVHLRANGPVTRDDPAPPIPVLIRYYTRFPDQFGRIQTYPDIYKLAGGADKQARAGC